MNVHSTLRKGNIAIEKSWNVEEVSLFGFCEKVDGLPNFIRAFGRGELSSKELAESMADIAIDLDRLALRYDIDLDDAIARKFNKISDELRLPHYLKYWDKKQ